MTRRSADPLNCAIALAVYSLSVMLSTGLTGWTSAVARPILVDSEPVPLPEPPPPKPIPRPPKPVPPVPPIPPEPEPPSPVPPVPGPQAPTP